MSLPIRGLWLIGAMVVLLPVGSLEAGTIRADRDPALYTALGSNPAYGSVGRVVASTGDSNFSASGTLINPSWMLTAGHVLEGLTALNFTVGGQTVAASDWYTPSQWNGDLLSGYDIGLVRLAEPITSATAAKRYTGTSERGATVTIVGYGMTGTGLTGATLNTNMKRGGQNVVDQVYNSRILLADFDNPGNKKDSSMGSASPLNLEYEIAPGDSGGGVFINTSKGMQLAGIATFAIGVDGKADSDYGDAEGFIRVSAFNSWIDSVIGGTAASSTFTTNTHTGTLNGTTTITPEPGTVLLLAAGTPLIILRRRRA